jgi:hypothetical protein
LCITGRKTPGTIILPEKGGNVKGGKAPVFAFFNLEFSLKTVCFEENIHRKVEEVEKGREKGDLKAKTYLTFSPLRLKILPKLGGFLGYESKCSHPEGGTGRAAANIGPRPPRLRP